MFLEVSDHEFVLSHLILMQAPASSERGGARSVAGSVSSQKPSATKKKNSSQKDVATAKATEQKEQLAAIYRFDKHWQSRQRRRDFDATCASAERVAGKCGSYVMDQDCMKVSQELFDFVEKLRARATLFDFVRTSFKALVDYELDAKHRELLKEADPESMVNIMVGSLQMLARCHHMDVLIREGSEKPSYIDVWDCRVSTPIASFEGFSCPR